MPRILATLLPAALLALTTFAAPPASADPCVEPCGVVTITGDCFNAVVTAEGTNGLVSVTWTFVSTKTDYPQASPHTATLTSPTAAFQKTWTHQDVPHAWTVTGTLYANGVAVATASEWFPGCV